MFLYLFGVFFMIGTVCVLLNMALRYANCNNKVIYRYYPNDSMNGGFASQIFKQMFTEQTPWVYGLINYDRRKAEVVNKYYISQI